jgi:ketosteroid isomerase-like protein
VSENLDFVRSLFATWERGDFRRTDWADPDIEFVIADGPSPGTWMGLAGLAEGFRLWIGGWKQFRSTAEDYREVDAGRILVFVRAHGRSGTSGITLEQLHTKGGANMIHVRDGRVTRLVLYYSRTHALADLGLQE